MAGKLVTRLSRNRQKPDDNTRRGKHNAIIRGNVNSMLFAANPGSREVMLRRKIFGKDFRSSDRGAVERRNKLNEGQTLPTDLGYHGPSQRAPSQQRRKRLKIGQSRDVTISGKQHRLVRIGKNEYGYADKTGQIVRTVDWHNEQRVRIRRSKKR